METHDISNFAKSLLSANVCYIRSPTAMTSSDGVNREAFGDASIRTGLYSFAIAAALQSAHQNPLTAFTAIPTCHKHQDHGKFHFGQCEVTSMIPYFSSKIRFTMSWKVFGEGL